MTRSYDEIEHELHCALDDLQRARMEIDKYRARFGREQQDAMANADPGHVCVCQHCKIVWDPKQRDAEQQNKLEEVEEERVKLFDETVALRQTIDGLRAQLAGLNRKVDQVATVIRFAADAMDLR